VARALATEGEGGPGDVKGVLRGGIGAGEDKGAFRGGDG
jgi:hypothetical protein